MLASSFRTRAPEASVARSPPITMVRLGIDTHPVTWAGARAPPTGTWGPAGAGAAPAATSAPEVTSEALDTSEVAAGTSAAVTRVTVAGVTVAVATGVMGADG